MMAYDVATMREIEEKWRRKDARFAHALQVAEAAFPGFAKNNGYEFVEDLDTRNAGLSDLVFLTGVFGLPNKPKPQP